MSMCTCCTWLFVFEHKTKVIFSSEILKEKNVGLFDLSSHLWYFFQTEQPVPDNIPPCSPFLSPHAKLPQTWRWTTHLGLKEPVNHPGPSLSVCQSLLPAGQLVCMIHGYLFKWALIKQFTQAATQPVSGMRLWSPLTRDSLEVAAVLELKKCCIKSCFPAVPRVFWSGGSIHSLPIYCFRTKLFYFKTSNLTVSNSPISCKEDNSGTGEERNEH